MLFLLIFACVMIHYHSNQYSSTQSTYLNYYDTQYTHTLQSDGDCGKLERVLYELGGIARVPPSRAAPTPPPPKDRWWLTMRTITID